MCSSAFETRSFPNSLAASSQFYLLCRFSRKIHSTFSACPSLSLASPRLHSRSRPRHFAFNVVHSRSPDRLGSIPTDQCSPSAGFPAGRIHPIRSIETRSLPALTRSYPHHFTFHAWRAVASAKAGRSSHSLNSGDAMANEQKSVSPKPDWYQCLVLWSCYT